MRITAMLLLFGIATCLAGAAPATQTILTEATGDNRRVKLVSARVDETAAQRLVARFALANDRGNEVIAMVRFPAHTHTTHETTLMNIVVASIDWSDPADRHAWRDPRTVPVFSIPADSTRVEEFERWWFDKFETPATEK